MCRGTDCAMLYWSQVCVAEEVDYRTTQVLGSGSPQLPRVSRVWVGLCAVSQLGGSDTAVFTVGDIKCFWIIRDRIWLKLVR